MERRLWLAVLSAFPGRRWRLQHPIGRYIADIAEIGAKLVIEVDGGQHGEPQRRAYDRWRTWVLWFRGWRVARFWNHDVLENLDGVLETIRRRLDR